MILSNSHRLDGEFFRMSLSDSELYQALVIISGFLFWFASVNITASKALFQVHKR